MSIKEQIKSLLQSRDDIDKYNWVAVDKSGSVYVYVNPPVLLNITWNSNNGDFTLIEIGVIDTGDVDWKDLCYEIDILMDDGLSHIPTLSYDACEVLRSAIDTIGERGEGYDDGKERAMPKVVRMFNELTGHNLTTKDGWQFMVILKQVRGYQGKDKLDNYIDGAAYFALASEELNNGE